MKYSRKRLVFSLILLAITFISGCADSPTKTSADLPETPLPKSEYLIGPGDTLQVFVWRNPDLSVTVPVRPDGRISIPLVEDIPANGKSPTQLAREIEKQLARYVRNPVATVIVTDFVGTFDKQVRVIGQATKPQALPYRQNMALLDVMIEVGGLTEFAAGNKAKIIRTINNKKVELDVRLEDLLKNGDVSADIDMYPGDILIIPESWF